MRTRNQASQLPLTLSRYIELNKEITKKENPSLTNRQVLNKLTQEWYKKKDKIETWQQAEPLQKNLQKKTQKKPNSKKKYKRKGVQLRNKNKKKKTKQNVPRIKSVERGEELKLNKSLSVISEEYSKENEESEFYVTPVSEPEQEIKYSPKKVCETKLEQKKAFKKLGKLKQKRRLQKNLEKQSEPEQNQQVSNQIPAQDFINSANLIDYIHLITLTTEKCNQGCIELDEVDSIVSHTYGLTNQFSENSNLNLQLYFEVSFKRQENGYIPENTYCNAKQLAFYYYKLYEDYIYQHKNIFTKEPDYYIK